MWTRSCVYLSLVMDFFNLNDCLHGDIDDWHMTALTDPRPAA